MKSFWAEVSSSVSLNTFFFMFQNVRHHISPRAFTLSEPCEVFGLCVLLHQTLHSLMGGDGSSYIDDDSDDDVANLFLLAGRK